MEIKNKKKKEKYRKKILDEMSNEVKVKTKKARKV